MKLVFYKIFISIVCLIAFVSCIGISMDIYGRYKNNYEEYENASKSFAHDCLDNEGKISFESYDRASDGTCMFQKKDFKEPSTAGLLLEIVTTLLAVPFIAWLLIKWFRWVFKVSLRSEE